DHPLKHMEHRGIFDSGCSGHMTGNRAHLEGYPTDGTFTFWKSFFTPQWRYLVHHLLHCISSKSGGWDQFGSNIATALICLSTGQEHVAVAQSQPSSSSPQAPPPPITTPTPTPPPIPTPTPPSITTPT
ncbi:hypothetical protein Tco_0019487, partial [Tanacetum coccineum]